jgi:hypothetical protein
VRVQRQVVGGERDVAVEEQLQTALELRVDGSYGAPEEAVVDEDEVGAFLDSALKQRC